jgi:hypothetical protein
MRVRQPVPQHALNEGEGYCRVDRNLSLEVMWLDRHRVVAETEAEIGLAKCGAEEWDLSSMCKRLFDRVHCRKAEQA